MLQMTSRFSEYFDIGKCFDNDLSTMCATAEGDPSPAITIQIFDFFDEIKIWNPTTVDHMYRIVNGSIKVYYMSDDLRAYGGHVLVGTCSIGSYQDFYSWKPFGWPSKRPMIPATGRISALPDYTFAIDTSRLVPMLSYVRLGGLMHRNFIATLCEKLGYKIGAELGVMDGLFSHNILMRWPSNEKYYLIDIWAPLENYFDRANVDTIQQDQRLQGAKERLKEYENKTFFLRNLTIDAAKLIPDNSLDFVYIDARHDYCGCMQDLETYWPKLRSGGLMSGHDFVTAADHAQYFPRDDWSVCEDGSIHPGAVKAAVIEFAALHNLDIYTTPDGPYFSWLYSIKPQHTILG